MKRPNFFIIGAPKCGTTAWVEYLSSHPDIAFSRFKEPHYFCTDFPNFRWVKSESGYLDLFSECGNARMVGEASVQYINSLEAPHNIASFAPNARILLFLREPVSFLRSYHNQLLLNLDEDVEDFGIAWSLSGKREGANLPPTNREPAFLDYRSVARFGAHIQRWLEHFPPEQIMVVDFADWVQVPRQTYLAILGFLGVPDDGRTVFPKVHPAKRHRSGLIARLASRPPEALLRSAAFVRWATGRKRLGVASRLRRLNSAQGYSQQESVPPEIEREIHDFLAADQNALASLRRLCR